ncbi:hypothetical protein E1263_18710 [Kribbella antibiotica]|uniref:Uncharacterized protein n=1 Tax=Kribbella antibiotica TaxID=190195 RepID=A0A4V2YPJ5_9ACTN|nr:hypothetical protein [Kribbella antibiotica]TDD58547.1 hypothetical protein E1263_18710 [Kribbella antibiotica]
MVTDMAAAERMVERLLAVEWDRDAAFAHQRSRARLAREFLRRTAQWAVAVGAERGWPASDLAAAVSPDVSVDPALLAKLDLDETSSNLFPVPSEIGPQIVRWAALGDLPRQRFPQFLDPYEPLLELFARGGGYARAPGELDLGFGSVPIRKVAARATLAALPIDAASLDALDQEG